MAKNRKHINETIEEYLKDMESMVYGTFPAATKWLTDKPYRKYLFDNNPECILSMKNMYGREIPFFPICNRSAVANKDLVKKAIEIAKSFQGDGRLDQERQKEIITRLISLEEE